jgi:hypothetical protein
MANRRPLVREAGRTKELSNSDALQIGQLVVDASGLTAQRTATLPDKSGTLAMLDDLSGGGVSLGKVIAIKGTFN